MFWGIRYTEKEMKAAIQAAIFQGMDMAINHLEEMPKGLKKSEIVQIMRTALSKSKKKMGV